MSNTKWDYCAIRASLDGQVMKLKFFNNDENHEVRDIEDPHHEIAKLGDDGWEMVTLTQITQPDSRVYYFKRPRD